MPKQNIKTNKGFTIIEVVLVLAIAGLIFLMVFIALPALQRSQRDTQRRDDLARVATAITQYQTNNNGKLPDAQTCDAGAELTATCSFIKNYLNPSGASSNEFVDPDGTAYGMKVVVGATGNDLKAPDSLDHIVYIYTKARCDGETPATANNARNYAILYKLEGAGVYCADNQ